MKQLELIRCSGPWTEETICLLEAEVRAPLPAEYRSFLKGQGSGIAGPANRFIDHRLHPELAQSVGIDEFYGVDDMTEKWRTYSGRVPPQFLPIGGDAFGDLVCLSLSTSNPIVVFWDHEKEELAYDLVAEIPPLGEDSIMKIANSFSEFVDMLGPTPDS